MFDAGATMTTFAINSNLINKIALLQKVLFLLVCKDIVPLINHTYEIIPFHPYDFFDDSR